MSDGQASSTCWWRHAGHLARISGAASLIVRVRVVTAGLLDDSLHRESTSSNDRRKAACSSADARVDIVCCQHCAVPFCALSALPGVVPPGPVGRKYGPIRDFLSSTACFYERTGGNGRGGI